VNIFHQTMVYAASFHTDLGSSTEVLMFYLMFSQALFMSSLSFNVSKAAYLFEILIWYCFLTPAQLASWD